MIKRNEFKKQLDKCYSLDVKLSNELSKLGAMATEIAGEDLIADLCHGGELEFRHSEDGISADADDAVPETEILKKIDNPDYEIRSWKKYIFL